MAEFALFLAGWGLGAVMMLPAVAMAWLVARGDVRLVWVGTTQPESPDARRTRMDAEYAEAAGRG